MRKYSFLWLILLSLQLRAGDFDGVKALAERRTPWLSQELVFEKLSIPGKEVFELQTRNGKLVISATGPNAAAVGLNWYLKYYCNRSLSHMGDNLSPVSPLPVVQTALRKEASSQYRYALNYCTYNYTMSFYDWKAWEHELDWMALNGINTMLVANGEEAVWQNVLRRIGYTQKEIDDYITGPAFNAWWLMGNIEGWGGPMPQSQIDSRKVLVQEMIARMQSLGIAPVMPGFYGMVPSSLKNKTSARIIPQGNWGAFTRPDILDPTDTAFSRIAGIFYEETKKLYGSNIHLFSGDPFHEGGITTGVDLAKAGVNIQKSMQQYFPGAIWVLQGWQDNPRKEMLAQVDKSTILVQELFGETTNNWEKRNGYEGTPFIWCMVNNFGERPGLYGKLQRYADETHRARTGTFGQYMKGVGIMPEGIDNNPVSYELLMELAWHQEHVNVDEWIKTYVKSRYGKSDEHLLQAWQLLLQTAYNSVPGYQEGPPENILCARPALEIKSVSSWGTLKKNYDTASFAAAVRLFTEAAPRFRNSETYLLDRINFSRQVLSNQADYAFAELVKAYNSKDSVSFDVAANSFLQLCTRLNNLLNIHPFYRLSTYQQQAWRAGNTSAEKENNLHNAMMLITYWGANNRKEDYLHEYAYKEWGGMMDTFYKKRWEIYFGYLRKLMKGAAVPPPDYFAWERDWVKTNERIK
ncbi:alpha-N-acetylglucosaminidase [Chitinophaga sp. CF418]|uniref:alpha-N-acetylglucosaminidase n=1 Tax=Chitinophaga sp. CF418 TaxID=1855287 RepID=UPI000915D6EA|nr:alpha-N-acetylglucosaminidase [Chitinophaga sp. CF418]SHN22148.1 alpha-N-acetylglucosaminidase [Chitinophaga sp. CF418]